MSNFFHFVKGKKSKKIIKIFSKKLLTKVKKGVIMQSKVKESQSQISTLTKIRQFIRKKGVNI